MTKYSLRNFLATLLISIVLFTPIIPGAFVFQDAHAGPAIQINEDTTWSEDQIISGPVLIFDATLTITEGVSVTFKQGGSMIIGDTLDVRGTASDPVIFKAENNTVDYSINIFGNASFRNADISGGGSSVSIISRNTRNLIRSADASILIGAIAFHGGILEIENTYFHNNLVALSLENTAPFDPEVVVHRSSFFDNEQSDVISTISDQQDFRYNWWGSSDGPNLAKLSGPINTDFWRETKQFRDPVIIVPGILGSAVKNGNTILDPYFHTYDGLYDFLDDNGYTPNTDLFAFPYEWRDSNAVNAQLLRNKIQQIKLANNWPKVDVVAHSMGGLLAREYIASSEYEDDVDQLITLGTPHRGSPNAYLMWEGGTVPPSNSNILDIFAEFIFRHESSKMGYESLLDYIRNRPIESVRELLPVYDYLRNEDNGELRTYPTDYPRNPFLENLNFPDSLESLRNVEVINIVGKNGPNSTIAEINVGNPSILPENIWEDGIPTGFDGGTSDNAFRFDEGDQTVPFVSASAINADQYFETNLSHGDLPSDASETVYEVLTGESITKENKSSFVNKIFGAFVFSPVDIQVVAPDGKRIGKDFSTGELFDEIDGAYYTGYDTETEFLTIPNPLDGEYKVLTQGTGDGAYKIELVRLEEKENGEVAETTAVIEDTTTTGSIEEKVIEVTEDEIDIGIGTSDTTPPEITIIEPENNGIYTNDSQITIDYSVIDNVSLSNAITKDIKLDEAEFNENTIDLSLQHLGIHAFSVSATDEADNVSTKNVSFENATNPEALLSVISHYYDLGLITDNETKKLLKKAVRYIRIAEKMMEKNQDGRKISRFTDKFIKSIEKYITQKGNRQIDAYAAELLIEDLEYIRTNFNN